jgi:hypothetical protein
MKRKKSAAAPPEEEALGEEPQRRVIERPDGFYWRSVQDGEERGPFASLAEAEADMLSGGAADTGLEATDLQEAESEIGVAEWIDPDTGGPAEDSVPRIEDH